MEKGRKEVSDILKTIFESIVDTLVISYLLVVCLVFIVIAFAIYPLKRARICIGHQLLRIVNTMDYYLTDTME